MANPAASPATTGAITAGSRILDTTTEKFTPEAPAPISTAPIRPPNRACDELDGSPKSQVVRFHRIAATSPAKIMVGVTSASLTMPPEIVLATSVDRKAPTTFSTAAISTAVLGLKAPVATEVAIAFALSWKPLVKSKNSAVTITTATRNNVLVMAEVTYLRIARRVCPVEFGHFLGAGWCVDAQGISALSCPPGPNGLDLTVLLR